MESELGVIIIAASLVVVFFSLMILFVIFLYRGARRRHQLTEQTIKREFESELLRTELEIAEEVTNQLSQELHDDLGQLLSHAIHLHSHGKIDELGDLLHRLRIDVRNLSHSLHNAKITEIGLDLAIDRLCNTHYASYRPPCIYRATDAFIKLSPQQEIFLYRCVQQAIENAYKHAHASTIEVTLEVSDDTLILTIADNGKGFDPHASPEGIGLISIANRVKMVKGRLTLESRPGAGCTLRIEKPLIQA